MKPRRLTLYTDGASWGNPGPAAIGVVLYRDASRPVRQVRRTIGRATNNVAEYTALLVGLREARRLGAEELEVLADSELLVKQLHGEYRVKDETLRALWDQAQALLEAFPRVVIRHIPREQNREADRLAQQALRERLRRGRVGQVAAPVAGTGEESPSSIGQRRG